MKKSNFNSIIDSIYQNQDPIEQWLSTVISEKNYPLYSSIDIRDAGFKMAAVDTNLFPAGFNNLCLKRSPDIIQLFKRSVIERVENCKNILIICEEHTRNKWYLENVYVLQNIAESAGYHVTVATFMSDLEIEKDQAFIEMETAKGNKLSIYRLRHMIQEWKNKKRDIDLIILNNDLSSGMPDDLFHGDIPMFPWAELGWHKRRKSTHFNQFNQVCQEFVRSIDIPELDAWFFSTLFEETESIDIILEEDRHKVADIAEQLLNKIQEKYNNYQIKETPFLFMKAESGTYGMGVVPIQSADEIRQMNRRTRNKLLKGKGSQSVTHYILQEGIPTNLKIDNTVAELVIYQFSNQFAGSFYRLNPLKSERQNLNSTGMTFKQSCLDSNIYDLFQKKEAFIQDADGHQIELARLYCASILGRLSAIATYREKEALGENK